jgi:hypothetical protein
MDGVEGKAYDEVGEPAYIPESGRLVYWAQSGKGHFLVTDGKEQPLKAVKGWYKIAGFAPKTGDPILAVSDGDNSRMVVGKAEGPYANMRLLPVRCTGGCEHSVYAIAQIEDQTFKSGRSYGRVVVDGKPGREYPSEPPESTGKALVRALGGSAVSLRPGDYSEFTPKIHGVSTPTITEDFRHVAYAARRDKKDFVVVTDGVEGSRLEAVPCEPRYSPEGKLFFVGVREGKATLFIDGKDNWNVSLPMPEWDDKGFCIGPSFAEGGHFVIGISQRDGLRLIADGKESKLRVTNVLVGPFVQVDNGRFHHAFFARPELSKPETFVIMDGKESKVYNDIWPETVKWTAPGVLTFLARQDQKLLRVTQTIP